MVANTYAQRKKQTLKTVSYKPEIHESLKFREIGPFRGGRSAAVVGVKNNPNLYYFGGTGGGVWKTEDAGKTYENISDGYFGGSIGAIAIAPSDSNVIYVGGGEVTVRGNVSSGNGVWKSLDAGKTWTFSGLPKSRHIPRIVIDSNNPDIVYAAVLGDIYSPTKERGVYKSVNGGKTWKKVLFVNEQAGAVEIQIDPNNSRVLFASTWNLKRTPYSLNSGGPGSLLWKSNDSGNSWHKISDNQGFAKGVLGIIGVTVSPVNSERVYAIVENKDKGGVYRSDNGGDTWKYINSSRALRQRAWYYSKIYADTKNQDVVYVMNVSYHKSIDGGKTFESKRAPHGDHHDLWIAPEDNNRMIIADDGGAQISKNGGLDWSTYYNQPTAQFYRITTDNAFPFRIYVAQQDNSTIRVQHRSEGRFITEDNWESTAGGESAHIAVDPNNNDIVYGGSYGGFLTRVNHKTGSIRGINVWPDNPMGYGAEGMKYRFQWNFPIFFSNHDTKKLFTLSNHVHVSENEGQSWKIISPDLTRNDPEKLKSSGGPITQDNTGVEYYSTLFAASESKLADGEIWVGSDDGLIHLTRNGGKNWENITPIQAPKFLMINSIETAYFISGKAYVAGTSYKSGDFKPYLYKTNDYGKTWKKIVNGIKPEHFTRVLRSDPSSQGLLYAGTESGLYISYDDGESWNSFQKNLPIVPITDITIKDNSLIIATQGRGIWILDDLTVLHQINSNTENNEMNLFTPKDSYRMRGSGGDKSKVAGTNLENGVIVYYNLKSYDSSKDSISLSFSNAEGKVIKTFTNYDKANLLKVNKGSNKFVWDTKHDGAKVLDGMIFWSASFSGAKSVPGKYMVTLSKNGIKKSKPFKILIDPRAEVSEEDIQKQLNFVNTVNEVVDKAHKAIQKIREINSKLKEFESVFKDSTNEKDLISRSKQIRNKLSKIEKMLYQTQNKSNQDPLNFPIRLTNKLGHLNRLVTLYDFPPTDQDEAVRLELTKRVDKQLEIFDTLIKNDVKKFNQEFLNLELDYLKIE
ncbi:MAG: glycosyl hydrolase [Flavobacteriaceae bacterium]|nr:glycosyl hydrolase [Flavobacteriaceae bacterium]